MSEHDEHDEAAENTEAVEHDPRPKAWPVDEQPEPHDPTGDGNTDGQDESSPIESRAAIVQDEDGYGHHAESANGDGESTE